MLKQFLAGFVVAVMLSGAAVAGPVEDATAAYKRGDYATALRLLRPLAEQGDAGAQFNIGLMYKEGNGVPQDYDEAVRWLTRAGEQGFDVAQCNLGFMYGAGEGVPEDDAKAVSWLTRAAEQGFAICQNSLGAMYANGKGVPQDFVLAHLWFNLAAAQGHEEARKNRDNVAGRMTPDQIAEAQRMAREWKPATER